MIEKIIWSYTIESGYFIVAGISEGRIDRLR